ncbi:hypothetical protein HRS9122_00431 [Pyrenophora teres f. teres]|nr:hypothetical protein HRS9122_00431 [Pyrenophora teres f. teres]
MPDDEVFRKKVQNKIQTLISERKEKSTGRLLVEAVVEGVKLYRGFKEEQKREDREKKGKGERHTHRHNMDIALDLDIGDIIVKTAIGVLPHLDKSDKERDPITYTATDPDPDLEIKDIPDLVEKRIAQIPQTRSTTTLSMK